MENDNIFEFAHTKRWLEKECDNQCDNIFIHLMLIIWCKFNDPKNQNINHWKSELSAFLNKITYKKIKTGDKNSKLEILKNRLLDAPDFIEYNDVRNNFIGMITLKLYNPNHGYDVSKGMYDYYIIKINELIKACAESDANRLYKEINEI